MLVVQIVQESPIFFFQLWVSQGFLSIFPSIEMSQVPYGSEDRGRPEREGFLKERYHQIIHIVGFYPKPSILGTIMYGKLHLVKIVNPISRIQCENPG